MSLISEDIIEFSNLQFNYVVPFIFGKRDTRYICLEVGFDSARGDCMNIKLVLKMRSRNAYIVFISFPATH